MREPMHIHSEATPSTGHLEIDLADLVSAASTCATSDPGPDPNDDPDEFPKATRVLRA